MIQAFTDWLFGLFKSAFQAVWDIVSDLFVSIADTIFTTLANVIISIPVPTFMTDYSLSSLFGMLPDYVLYFVGAMNIGQCFAIIGAGFAFRMLRKLCTLGQW